MLIGAIIGFLFGEPRGVPSVFLQAKRQLFVQKGGVELHRALSAGLSTESVLR